MARKTRSLALLALAGTAALPALAQARIVIYAGADWRYFVGNPDPWHCETLVDEVFYMTDSVQYHAVRQNHGFNPFHAGGVAFFTSGAFGIPEDLVLVTTVYGLDLTSDSHLPSLSGFDPSDPELTPMSGETIWSSDGQMFTSHFQTSILLGEIGALLPGHDLSWFALGDPNSLLHAFQTLAPFDALYVPSPGSVALLGIGGAVALRRRRRADHSR